MTSEADSIIAASDHAQPAAPWCWFRLDAQGLILEASPSLEQLTGTSVQHLKRQQKSWNDLILEADRPLFQKHVRNAETNPNGTTVVVRVRHATTHRTLWIQEFRKPILAPHGKVQGFEGIWLDVSQFHAFENRLRDVAWKETLEVLIPGLIHEFNNTLAAIQSLSDLFLGQIEAGHPFHDGLTVIRQTTQQACQRLQRLYSLHRSAPGSRCYQDLNEVSREMVDLLRRALRRRTDLELTTAASTLPVYADPVELQQTIIQLALNAMEAMPEGGRIRFQTRLWTQPPEAARNLRAPVVALSVEDSGAGLPASELPKVFDPLYTTKADRSAGLGLYRAQLFAQSHQGTVTAQSQPGFGSTFTLWLPQADFSEAEANPGTEKRD
jgi:PAS domain S-box-containing protein